MMINDNACMTIISLQLCITTIIIVTMVYTSFLTSHLLHFVYNRIYVCPYIAGADISNISNLESPATLTFPLVQPKGAPYLCKYWEATSRTWRTEGVTTSLQTADTVVCTTTHLTDFTVVSGKLCFFPVLSFDRQSFSRTGPRQVHHMTTLRASHDHAIMTAPRDLLTACRLLLCGLILVAR